METHTRTISVYTSMPTSIPASSFTAKPPDPVSKPNSISNHPTQHAFREAPHFLSSELREQRARALALMLGPSSDPTRLSFQPNLNHLPNEAAMHALPVIQQQLVGYLGQLNLHQNWLILMCSKSSRKCKQCLCISYTCIRAYSLRFFVSLAEEIVRYKSAASAPGWCSGSHSCADSGSDTKE